MEKDKYKEDLYTKKNYILTKFTPIFLNFEKLYSIIKMKFWIGNDRIFLGLL